MRANRLFTLFLRTQTAMYKGTKLQERKRLCIMFVDAWFDITGGRFLSLIPNAIAQWRLMTKRQCVQKVMDIFRKRLIPKMKEQSVEGVAVDSRHVGGEYMVDINDNNAPEENHDIANNHSEETQVDPSIIE